MALDPLNNINESISEVEAAQDPLSAFNRMFSDVNTGIPTNPYPVISAPIPRTTSTAVDINQNLVGNEVTGPAPGINNTTPQGNKSFVDSALDYMDNAETWAKDKYKYGRTYSYGAGYKNMQFERFYTHPNYKKLGFSPYRNNEEIYNENSTWMDDWRRSSHQYWKLLSNGFGSSVFGSDDFKAAETMQEGLALGSSSKEGIGSSITNFGLSSMYTLGMGAEILAENVALGFLEAGALALAPETLGATLPTVAAAAARQTTNLVRFTEGLKKTYDFVKSLRQVEKAREFFSLAKAGKTALSVGKYLNPFEKTLEYTNFLAKSERVWSGTEKMALAAHGFGHFFKELREISLVTEEAGLEGAMARSEYHQKLIDEYYAKNGKMPEGTDAEAIYQKAASVDFSVGMFNMPAIYLSNKIVFGKYLKGFPTMSSIVKSIKKGSERYLKKTAAGEVLEKGAYELVEKSGKRKIAESFLSSPYVPWSREYFTANMTEAIQENTQDAISSAVKAYHDKIDKDPSVAGFWEGASQFGTGIKGQFNKQGLETFLSGYLTGFLVGGIGGTVTNTASAIKSRTKSGQAKVQAAKERRKVREESIKDSVNAMAMDAINIGARNATSASEVKNHAEESDKAASEGNQYKYNTSKDNMFAAHAFNLARANKTELFTSHIDDMLNLSDEDLTKAYNMQLNEAQELRSRLNNAKERSLDIKNTYEQVKEEYPNPVDLSMVDPSKDKVLYDKMVAKYNAHEFAIHAITTSTEALKRTNGRLIGIVNEFSQASPWLSVRRGAQQVKDAGASDITALLDSYQRERLIETLQLEADTLKEGTAQQKKQAKSKLAKIEQLKAWNEITDAFRLLGSLREAAFKNKSQSLESIDKEINRLTKVMYPVFDKYTKLIAEEQGGTLMSKELGKAFIKVRDYHLLESDSNSYTKALNILNDPLYFDRFISAVETAQEELEKTKAERIAEGYTKFMGYLDLEEYNDFLNEIYDHGMFVIPESIEEFVKDPRTAKFTLYDTAKKEPVVPGTPAYEVFEKILNERYPVKEAVVKEAAPTEEAPSKGAAISINDNINDMPKELQDELIAAFEDLKEYYASERPGDAFPFFNFQQFLVRSGKAKQIIDNYNKKNGLVAKPAEATKKPEPAKASVPLTITSQVRQQLYDLGYSKADIDAMKPADAQDIITNQTTKAKVPVTPAPVSTDAKISPYGMIAADYLFTGGQGVMLSTDYFIQALSGAFYKAGVAIEQIRQKYINQGIDLGNLKDAIGTENYTKIIDEIRSVIESTYNNQEVNDIFNVVLNNATGFPYRLGQEVSSKLETLNEQLTTQQPSVSTDVKADIEKLGKQIQKLPFNTINKLGNLLGGKGAFKEIEDVADAVAYSYYTNKNSDLIKAVDAELKALESTQTESTTPVVTDTEAKRAEIIKKYDDQIKSIDKVKNAKNIEELKKASLEAFKVDPLDKGVIPLDTLEALLTPGAFELGKQRLLNQYEKIVTENINKLRNKELAALQGKAPVAEVKPGEFEVTTASVEEVKERLKALKEKNLIVDTDDSDYYIDENNPEDKWARVSTLKGKFEGKGGDAADRGTIIDSLLRDYIAGKISSLKELKAAYEKHPLNSNVDDFSDDFIENLFDIFQEVKANTEDIELISDIPTLWGVLNGEKYAGSIDLLGIRKNGEVFIIDLKTSSRNRRDVNDKYYTTYKEGDSIQQSAYAELLRQRTGITVKNVVIFPIQVSKIKKVYTEAIPNKDDKGKFTMSVTIDRKLFPEQALSPEAAEIEKVLKQEVEPAPEWFISDKEAVRNRILTELRSIEERMKIERTPDILDEINKLEDLALKANLSSLYINQISDITKRIRSEFKSISRIQIGDYIIFESNPTAKFEVVDKNENELMLYNQALPMEDRINTEPEIVTKKDMYKISKVIPAGGIETVELTQEEKEINKINASSMEDLLKNDEAIKAAFNSTKSIEETQKGLFDDLDNCAIK